MEWRRRVEQSPFHSASDMSTAEEPGVSVAMAIDHIHSDWSVLVQQDI